MPLFICSYFDTFLLQAEDIQTVEEAESAASELHLLTSSQSLTANETKKATENILAINQAVETNKFKVGP